MKKIFSFLSLTVLLIFLPAKSEDFGTWSYSTAYTLNTSPTGANVAGNVLDFPLRIRLDTSNFDFSQAKSDGTDIRFAKSNGDHLYYEREHWSQGATDSVAEFWVLIDTVYGNNNSQYITMYWGNAGAQDSSNSEAVFNTANNFNGVWHLNEDPTGTVFDRTSNANDGTSGGAMNSADLVDGAIGKGIDFDGTDDYIDVDSNASIDDLDTYTIGAWIYPKGWGELNNGRIIDKSNGAFTFYVSNTGGGSGLESIVMIRNRATTHTNVIASDYSLVLNSWAYVVAVMNGVSLSKLYINGNEAGYYLQDVGSGSLVSDAVDNLIIGNSSTGDCSYYGILDELRIGGTIRSADWIKLCYENQRPENTLLNGQPASVKVWDNGGADNNWSTGMNWNPDGVPTGTDSVVFDGGYTLDNCNLSNNVTVKAITFLSNYTGTFNLNNFTLSVKGDADFSIGGGGAIASGANGKIEFIDPNPHALTPPASGGLPSIKNQTGSGNVTVGGNNLSCDSLIVLAGTFDMNGNDLWAYYGLEVANSATFNGSSGNVNVSSVLNISSSSATFNAPSDTLFIEGSFNNSMNGTFNTGGPMVFNGTGPGFSIYPGSPTYNNMIFDGSGGEWYINDNLNADSVHIREGKLICGSGLYHSIGNLSSTNNTGVLDFSSCTLSVSYDADFSMLDTVNAGTGKLKLEGTGTQLLTPKASDTLPTVAHTATGTLQLAANNLMCNGFYQDAGVLNFNSKNIQTVAGGDFTILNGTATTFQNLEGDTITVAGNASFNGQSGNLLNMNSASTWWLNVAGTLDADYANIGNSNASLGSQGTPTANCSNSGGNTNWAFNTAPSISFDSYSQTSTDGSGEVTVQYDLSDSESDPCNLLIEYSYDNATWYQAYIKSASTGTVDNTGVNTGTSTGQITAITTLAIDENFVWDTKNAGNQNGTFNGEDADVYIRVTPNDGSDDGTIQTTPSFAVDNAGPTGLGSLNVSAYTSTTADMTWTAATEANFSHYEIWFGTSQTDVQNRTAGPGADEWDDADDGTLTSIASTTTTISGLTSGQTYWFKIWAIDTYGNEMTVTEISQSLNVAPTDIALSSSSINENESVGIVIGTFSTTDPNAGDTHNYSLVAGTGDADNASFSISADSLKTGAVFDFESQSSYSIRIRATDNGTGNLWYEEAFTITINDTNEPPVLSGSTGAVSYTENDAATVVDNAVSVTDIDNAGMVSAEVSISANYAMAEDSLLFADQNGITGSFNNTTGILTLSGSATLAFYNTAMQSIQYFNSSEAPNTSTRTVSFTTNDGTFNSNTETRDIMVNAVNDAPSAAADGYIISEDGYLSEEAGTGVLSNDTDPESDPLTAALVADVTNGTLFLNTDGSFTYTPSADFSGADGFTYQANDGVLNSTTQSVSITVNPVNDAPILTGSGGTLTFTEGDAATVIDNAVAVIDIDNANMVSAEVSISANYVAAEDSLLFTDQNGITGSFNNTTGVLTLSGSATLAFCNTAMQSIQYLNSSIAPSTATRAVSFTVNDGTGNSNTVTRDVSVVSLNDTPILSGMGGSITYTENDLPTVIDNDITVSDGDNATLASAEVSISANYATPEDALLFTDQNGITGSFNTVNGILTLSGSATIANYQAALRSVTYQNFSESPGTSIRTVSFTVNDGAANSNIITRDINITSINDAPIAIDTTYVINQNETLTEASPGVMGNDNDPDGDPLTAGLVSNVSNGTLALNTNGSFQYIPDINFYGIDSFTYQLNDGTLNSNNATVTITITDTSSPAVVSVSPADDATGVGVNDSFVMVFSEVVFAGSGNVSIAHSVDLSVFETIPVGSGGIAGSGTKTINIYPVNTFASETGYYILIDAACFKDSAGNYFPGYTSDTRWNFTTEDVLTQNPTLNTPVVGATLDSSFTIEFTLPENALNGSVKMILTQNSGNTDVNSPHIITFLSIYETAGTHSTILRGKDLSGNANIASISSEPNDALVNGGIYDVTIQYQDALGNPVAQTGNSNVVYVPLLDVVYASYYEESDAMVLAFDTTIESSSVATSKRIGLWISNGTADSIILDTPWQWQFGQTQDSVYVTLDTGEAAFVESWADIGTSLALYLQAGTFGNDIVSNTGIDYSSAFPVTYFDDNEPPESVTGMTASALNCSTMVVAWTPSTSPDAKEVKICASTISMPVIPGAGEYSQMVTSDVTSAAFTGLPKYGATVYTAAFIVDNADNWSDFSAVGSETITLPDGVPPENTISATFTNVGDSAVSISLELPDTLQNTEAGVYFTFNHNSYYDINRYRGKIRGDSISLVLGFHDTTFTMCDIVKPGLWFGEWAPFDSAGNIGPKKSDSIMINNSAPVITVLYQYDLKEDSAWTIDNCTYDINGDPITLTLIDAPLGMYVSQATRSITWTPANEDVGAHIVALVADDGTAQSDTATMVLTVNNANDSPILISAFFPDTAYEDSLVEGKIAVYDPDDSDSLNISFNIRISWLTAMVIPPSDSDSLWRFKLKGTPGNNDTGTVHFTAIIKDIEDITVSSDHSLYVVNTNDAPVTQCLNKKKMYGAAQYVMAGLDDFDSTFIFHARFCELDSAVVEDTVINSSGIFTFYPLADSRYRFSCHVQDRAGLIDLSPYEDTLTISSVLSQTWSDTGIWNMMSIPQPSYSAVQFKTIGKILHWDESKEPNSIYKYYIRSSQIQEFTGGKSYWSKLDAPVSVTLNRDSLSKDSIAIILQKAEYGWNQIASPYLYPVKWEKDLTLWKWNASIRDFEDVEGVLYPWEGYWVLTDAKDTVAVSPEPYFVTRAISRRSKTCFADKREWTFSIELTSNINRDADNLFGISRYAKNGYDKLDRPEPPRMGSEPYLYFAHPEWKRTVNEFASDIRKTWHDKENIFQIGISPCPQDVTALTLNISGYNKDALIYLFVNTSRGVVKYSEGMAIKIEPSDKVQYKTVFATSNREFLDNFPHKFVLSHPYPNPCRPSTTIQYVLPYRWDDNGWLNTKRYEVKMIIYDAHGREVRELVNRKQGPGHYKVVWRGTTDTGRRVASGFYFCRLETGKHSSVRKIIAIR